MWQYEHGIETTASRQAVWALWADVPGWGDWNADLESVVIDGPFETGSLITMKPEGQDAVELRIADAKENSGFTDVAQLGGIVVTTQHLIEPAGDGAHRIVYRMEITGPDADTAGAELGPMITADFPETIAALVALAER